VHAIVPVLVPIAPRGPQLNAGVEAAIGEILLFLHPDTVPDPGGIHELLIVMQEEHVVG